MNVLLDSFYPLSDPCNYTILKRCLKSIPPSLQVEPLLHKPERRRKPGASGIRYVCFSAVKATGEVVLIVLLGEHISQHVPGL